MKQEPEHVKIGFLGEDIACRFLQGKGYFVSERNYRKKQGEIDIIAKKGSNIHFFEVKTVSCEIREDNVNHETNEGYRPEDNMHSFKLKRLSNTISIFLLERNLEDINWTFNVVTVLLDRKNKKAKVSLLEDLTL
ncbi:MAG: YraN family protein [Patescibacteria group bacterium]